MNKSHLTVMLAVFVALSGCLRQQRQSDLADLVNYETYRGTIAHSDASAPSPFHLVLESLATPGEEFFLRLDSSILSDDVKLLADTKSYVEIFGYMSPSASGLFEVKKLKIVDKKLAEVAGTLAKNTTPFDSIPYMLTLSNGDIYKVLPESKALNADIKAAAEEDKKVLIEGYFDAEVRDILIAVRLVENRR